MSERTLTPLQLQTYAQQLCLEEKSPATVEKYLRDLHAFSVWAAGREINKELTAEWKAHLVEENYAHAERMAPKRAQKQKPGKIRHISGFFLLPKSAKDTCGAICFVLKFGYKYVR